MTTLAAYKTNLAGLQAMGQDDIDALFQQIINPDAEKVKAALQEILPGLMQLYGSASATLAANWYDDRRDTLKIPGSFTAIAAELPDDGRTDALAGWAVGPLFSDDPDQDTALVKLTGGFQRIVANAGRDTITGSSIADPHAEGWQRVGSGGSCEFCQMLLGRGAVYTEASADFETHDHCNCTAEPVFRDG